MIQFICKGLWSQCGLVYAVVSGCACSGSSGMDRLRTSLQLVIIVLKSVRRHPAAQALPLYLTSGGEEGEEGDESPIVCDVHLEKWVGKVEAKSEALASFSVKEKKKRICSRCNDCNRSFKSTIGSSFTVVSISSSIRWILLPCCVSWCQTWRTVMLVTFNGSATMSPCFSAVCLSAPYTTHSSI